MGTPTAKVYVPLSQEEKIPVVGLFTEAQLLYEPLKHEVSKVRASYYDQTREQVDKLWEQNAPKIGLLDQDDPFWQDRVGRCETGFANPYCDSGCDGHFHARQRGNRSGTQGGDWQRVLKPS